ncbi:MAG: SDR family oxidoreductase [Gemmatimonadales bacterium]|nr:MAG: SDR family oxidoreductase [Gemmatimonadales bacterium]
MADLTGRVAIVTGGSEGIGRSVVEALAGEGASVVLTSRSRDRATSVAGEIGGEVRGAVMGVGCDVRDPSQCRDLVSATVAAFGGLDILVNNAGLGIFKPIQEMSAEEYLVQVETNLNGVFFTTKAALDPLREADDAWVINIGSLASRNTFSGGVGYNASKFGLLGMTEAMMLDLRYDGIRTSIIMPGSVNTGFSDHGDRPWAIQPDDVGEAVLQLLSYPRHTLVSRVEMRPSAPPRK